VKQYRSRSRICYCRGIGTGHSSIDPDTAGVPPVLVTGAANDLSGL
ncbi:uncharacterized protein METZ01_LOCUS102778, partial [marine metagenome]